MLGPASVRAERSGGRHGLRRARDRHRDDPPRCARCDRSRGARTTPRGLCRLPLLQRPRKEGGGDHERDGSSERRRRATREPNWARPTCSRSSPGCATKSSSLPCTRCSASTSPRRKPSSTRGQIRSEICARVALHQPAFPPGGSPSLTGRRPRRPRASAPTPPGPSRESSSRVSSAGHRGRSASSRSWSRRPCRR